MPYRGTERGDLGLRGSSARVCGESHSRENLFKVIIRRLRLFRVGKARHFPALEDRVALLGLGFDQSGGAVADCRDGLFGVVELYGQLCTYVHGAQCTVKTRAK